MDPVQQKALNALEPYILLSKSATSPRAAVDLIRQATSAPNTFVFAELLQTPNIQALRNASEEHAPYLTLLEIFAWGTWKDYECLSSPITLALPSPIPNPSANLQVKKNRIEKKKHQLTHPSNPLPPPPLRTPIPQTPPPHPPRPVPLPQKPNLPLPPYLTLPTHDPRPRRPHHQRHLRRSPGRETRHPVPTRGHLFPSPLARSAS